MAKKIEPLANPYRSRTLAKAKRNMEDPRLAYDYNRVRSFVPRQHNARNLSPDKETVQQWGYICRAKDYDGKTIQQEAINLRWYMGRSKAASVVYCSVWVNPPRGTRFGYAGSDSEPNPLMWDRHPSGYGNAGGGGYDKFSAAACGAIRSAGFNLEGHFAGYGEAAIKAAVMAVADYMGLPLDGLIVQH
jgi:hypothetical protein